MPSDLIRNLTDELKNTVEILATRLHCEIESAGEIVKCLRNKTQEEIISVQMSFPNESCTKMRWWPVVEQDFGQDRLFEDQPTHLFEIGNFSKVPTLIGIISDEFAQEVPRVFYIFFWPT